MSLISVGTMAFDAIETPFGKTEQIIGGSAIYVMPLVYAGAPVVNVLLSMALHPPKRSPNPLLYLGMVLAAGGASMVLYFKPQS